MDFHAIESSNIDGVCYQPEFAALFVRFKNGKVWQYISVPMFIFDQFMDAKSKGAFFAKEIKPKYAGGLYTAEDEEADLAHGIGEENTAPRAVSKAKNPGATKPKKEPPTIRTGTIDL